MGMTPSPAPDTTVTRTRAFAEGLAALDDFELVSLIVGTRGASGVLEGVGLDALVRAGLGSLVALPGLGPAKAACLGASVELGRRIQQRQAAPRRPLATPQDVASFVGPQVGHLDHERMWVLSLDGRNGLRGMRCVAQGGRHGLTVTAREILAAALGDGACGFILVHNHPSGSPEPSAADQRMTESVARAADVLGVPLLDHVIVTPSGDYCSMLEAGCLGPVTASERSPASSSERPSLRAPPPPSA
jgi:DNA repair protein RadC